MLCSHLIRVPSGKLTEIYWKGYATILWGTCNLNTLLSIRHTCLHVVNQESLRTLEQTHKYMWSRLFLLIRYINNRKCVPYFKRNIVKLKGITYKWWWCVVLGVLFIFASWKNTINSSETSWAIKSLWRAKCLLIAWMINQVGVMNL